MLFNLRDIQPLNRVIYQQKFHEISSISFQILRKVKLTIPASLHYQFGVRGFIFIFEGSETTDHLANEDADAPDVGLVGVAGVEHDLGSAVARRSAVGEGPPVDVLQFLGEPEVNQLDVPLSVDQNVLWFQIPINYIFRMQTFDSQYDLGQVKSGIVFAHKD